MTKHQILAFDLISKVICCDSAQVYPEVLPGVEVEMM